MEDFEVTILDYGAGNVRSLRNAIKYLGYKVKDVQSIEDIASAQVILFPGQGCFHQAMQSLSSLGYVDALRQYIRDNRPFFGICLGMQLLFEGSEESPGIEGLGVIPGKVTRFDASSGVTVPQIGWNGMTPVKDCSVMNDIATADKAYFVHSFCALPTQANIDWILTTTDYGPQRYISIVQKGNVVAAQFHPEKSGAVGLRMIGNFLTTRGILQSTTPQLSLSDILLLPSTVMTNRVIACLDVRTNDQGDLVVTKGDQYDVREASAEESGGRGGVRNLGKPVALCKRYFDEGADEVSVRCTAAVTVA
jgi:glutamine amidotransferase/cyclase